MAVTPSSGLGSIEKEVRYYEELVDKAVHFKRYNVETRLDNKPGKQHYIWVKLGEAQITHEAARELVQRYIASGWTDAEAWSFNFPGTAFTIVQLYYDPDTRDIE